MHQFFSHVHIIIWALHHRIIKLSYPHLISKCHHINRYFSKDWTVTLPMKMHPFFYFRSYHYIIISLYHHIPISSYQHIIISTYHYIDISSFPHIIISTGTFQRLNRKFTPSWKCIHFQAHSYFILLTNWDHIIHRCFLK